MSAQPNIHLPRLGYSLAELEVLTGSSRATLYRRIADGTLKTVQHSRGGKRLVPTTEVEAFMRTTGAVANADP